MNLKQKIKIAYNIFNKIRTILKIEDNAYIYDYIKQQARLYKLSN